MFSKGISIGDRIKFKSVTRYSNETVSRKVNGFYNGWPTVRYAGHPNFIVRHHEIISVQPQSHTSAP